MVKDITIQDFFNLFVLCLSWQWNPISREKIYTTVDKVARILCGLGIIDEKCKKNLFKDRRLQGLFRVKCRTFYHSLVGDNINLILESSSILLIRGSITGDMSYAKVLKDTRIYMTPVGKKLAEQLEERYSSIITEQMYFEECKRQDDLLKNRSSCLGPVMENYRMKVRVALFSDSGD